MEKIKNLKELFIQQLNDLYYTKERQIENLTRLENKVSSNDLREEIKRHLHESNRQIDHLNMVFNKVNEMSVEGKCPGIDGLLEGQKNLLEKCDNPEIAEAAIIKCLQEINHYEIANYGSAATYARELGHDDIAKILHEALEEENRMDKHLTLLAKGQINKRALETQAQEKILL